MARAGETAPTHDILRTALRHVVAAADAGQEDLGAMALVIQETSALPRSAQVRAENLIRHELLYAPRAPVEARPGWLRQLIGLGQKKASATPIPLPAWLDLLSYSGHDRERALHSLADAAPNRFFLTLAIRRLNDWVPQVRSAARVTVPSLVHASEPALVADMLCVALPNWTTWGRAEEADNAIITSLVDIDGVAAALANLIIASPRGPMPVVLAQALRTSAQDKYLMQIATQAVQPAVRAQAYRALLRGKTTWVETSHWQHKDLWHRQGRMQKVLGERTLTNAPAFLPTLQQAAADHAPLVRRFAAEALVREMQKLGDAGLALATRLSTDPSPAVAERGKFALERSA